MSNKRVRGEQLYMFLGADYKPVGCSTDCALNASVDTIEVASSGAWRNFRPGKKTWSMDCSGFYLDDPTLPTNFLQGIKQVGTTVRVAMTVLASELSAAGLDIANLSPDTTHTIVGDAIITNCNYDGDRGGLATYSISFQGTGELKKI